MSGSSGQFEYVYVPADQTQPAEQRTMRFKDENEKVSCLTNAFNDHFREVSRRLSPEQKSAFIKQVLGQAAQNTPSFDPSTVDPKIVEQFAASQMTDAVPLMTPRRDNAFVGVTLYVDDSGSFKNLPTNYRATALTECCGRPTHVLGDAFIARAVDDGDDLFHRKDFTLADFSPDVAWVQEAKAFAAAKAAQGGGAAAAGLSGAMSANEAKAAVAAQQRAAATAAAAAKKGKPPTTAALGKWRSQLDAWVAGKLKQWDEDETFRTARQEQHATREAYEAYLKKKTDKQYAQKAGTQAS